MTKKTVYLLLALALPGLTFLFLKFFGKNHFDIPVYYKEGVPVESIECSKDFHGQYILPDSVLRILGCKPDVACLFVDASKKNDKDVLQLKHSFSENQLQIVSLEGIEPDRLNHLKNCSLFLKYPWMAVLVDKEKRIRGYYAFTNLEETDRLKVEVEILLTNN